MNDKTRVLFICSHNSARSQMAEAILRRSAGDRFEVYSAGLRPEPIDRDTFQVMEEKGYDLSDHESKGVDEFLAKVLFGYVITVCSDADRECPQSWMGVPRVLNWPFEDPSAFAGSPEERLARFREVRDQIERKVEEWLASMG